MISYHFVIFYRKHCRFDPKMIKMHSTANKSNFQPIDLQKVSK